MTEPTTIKDAPLLDRDDPTARGLAARDRVPPAGHGLWQPDPARADPVALLQEQSATRMPELIAIRHGRMMASPATFYRGAALPMASDLSTTPVSGITVQLGGDAHLANFGLFASPERHLLFDMNDFDETLPGPWEWDLKRLAASLVVAGRERGFEAHHILHAVHTTVRSYRERMHAFAAMGALEIYYSHVDAATITDFVDQRARRYLETTVRSASHHDVLHELPKLTEVVDGTRRIVDRPPTIYHSPLLEPQVATEGLAAYRASLLEDRRALLDRFDYVDAAIKVVGVGSVGLIALAALLVERDGDSALLLQIKEAEASVLERFLGVSGYANHGQRVVAGQRLLQAASDVFLGWTVGRQDRHFYVRQLHDQKGSAVLEAMTHTDLLAWGELCGWALARGHARTGEPAAIAAYLGDDDAMDHAVGKFSVAYADLTERDHGAFLAAIKAGRLPAESGV